MKQLAKDYKRIVVKVGSSLLFTRETQADSFIYPMNEIAGQISDLVNSGKEVVIVSSGAIALGMSLLKMKLRPKELSTLQATAAVGQHFLMNQYRRFFYEKGVNCGQILLTWDDFDNRKRYLNAKNTLLTLLKLGVIPIINENDSISTEEIKFGDNDRLSALVASLINADLLVILSDVDGLLDRDKRIIKIVTEINAPIKELASPTDKKTSVGGMITKLEAAKIAADSGIPCIIANGKNKSIILEIMEDAGPIGKWTLFLPAKSCLVAKKRWIAFGAKPKGKIIVDEGAKSALRNKKSLLAVGVLSIEGVFENGDIVSVMNGSGLELARGIVGFSNRHLDKIKGARYGKEVIHRDNIVIL